MWTKTTLIIDDNYEQHLKILSKLDEPLGDCNLEELQMSWIIEILNCLGFYKISHLLNVAYKIIIMQY